MLENNKRVEDLRDEIIEKNNIEKGNKLRLFFNGQKMVKRNKISKYSITNRTIILVKVIRRTIKDNIRSAMSPRANARRIRGGIFGPRIRDWSWSRNRI
tara:strand:+ start:645 stop:941 length:297 start_codon:yes stop_codon:yes gene_type:complete